MATQARPAKTANLAQVARRAKVSTGTVSRVFNNSDLIPVETRSRVLSIARELGVRPRIGVRNKQIVLVTEPPHRTLMGGYVSTLTQYMCFALSRADAGISMITEDRIDSLANSWFDGIIGVAWEDRTIDKLKMIKNTPVIWLSDMYIDHFHCIYLNCQKTGLLVGDYLVSKGHKKIAVIHEIDYSGLGRAEGLGMAMENNGLDTLECLTKLPNTMSLHLAVKQIIDQECTAVWVTGEDMKVLEVNWLIQELAGKKIPEDISLIGFENPGITEFMRPALTTVKSPLMEIAEKAVETVLSEDLEGLINIEMQVELIERNSVRSI